MQHTALLPNSRELCVTSAAPCRECCVQQLLLQASQRLWAGRDYVHAACSALHLLLLRLGPSQQLGRCTADVEAPHSCQLGLG